MTHLFVYYFFIILNDLPIKLTFTSLVVDGKFAMKRTYFGICTAAKDFQLLNNCY